MTGQQLKNSILQLAIQGKLVPQDPNDEPASELLKRIRAEKERLIKAKAIKKEKPLDEISDEEKPFEIPEGWDWCRLGEIISIKSGDGLTSKDMVEGEIPVFGGNGITGYHNESNVNEETIVIGRVGFYCGSVHVTPKKAWVTDNAFITSYSKTNLFRDFLVYLLIFSKLGDNHNATAQPVVSGRKIYPLIVPLPPLSEQHRIVSKLEQLLPLVDEYGKSQEALDKLNAELPDKLRQSILQDAIQGKLGTQDPNDEPASILLQRIREEKAKLIKTKVIKKENPLPEITEDEKPFEIPEGWTWCRLGEISTLITKGTTPRGGNVAYSSSGIGFLRAENLGGFDKLNLNNLKYIDKSTHEGALARSIIYEDDILITIAGTLGRTGFVRKEDLPLNSNQAVSIVRIVDKCLSDLKYLIYALNCFDVQKKWKDLTKTTAIPNLTLEIIENTIIALPPLAEQHRIVEKLNSILPKLK